MKTLFAIFCMVYTTLAVATADTEFDCQSNDKKWHVHVDAYLTGHPMGGLASLEGIMTVDGLGRSDKFHVNFQPFYSELNLTGKSSKVLPKLDFQLQTKREMLVERIIVDSSLNIRESAIGPKPATDWQKFPVVCSIID